MCKAFATQRNIMVSESTMAISVLPWDFQGRFYDKNKWEASSPFFYRNPHGAIDDFLTNLKNSPYYDLTEFNDKRDEAEGCIRGFCMVLFCVIILWPLFIYLTIEKLKKPAKAREESFAKIIADWNQDKGAAYNVKISLGTDAHFF